MRSKVQMLSPDFEFARTLAAEAVQEQCTSLEHFLTVLSATSALTPELWAVPWAQAVAEWQTWNANKEELPVPPLQSLFVGTEVAEQLGRCTAWAHLGEDDFVARHLRDPNGVGTAAPAIFKQKVSNMATDAMHTCKNTLLTHNLNLQSVDAVNLMARDGKIKDVAINMFTPTFKEMSMPYVFCDIVGKNLYRTHRQELDAWPHEAVVTAAKRCLGLAGEHVQDHSNSKLVPSEPAFGTLGVLGPSGLVSVVGGRMCKCSMHLAMHGLS